MALMGILAKGLGSALGGLFVRKVTTVAPDTGEESTSNKARPFPVATAFVLGAALLWHFLLWPVLNYHFPEYGFPAIDAALLSVLAGLGL